jgi:cation:H+ antiporter
MISLNLLLLIIGFAALAWSASWLVNGATELAIHLRISPIVIGLGVISLGTSAPELVVSIIAALDGKTGLSVGNVFGSNIANLGLVLGITAIIAPLKVSWLTIKREFMLMLVATTVVGVVLANAYLGRIDAFILFIVLLLVVYLIYRSEANAHQLTEEVDTSTARLSLLRASIYTLLGIIFLIISARVIVYAAIELATIWQVSEVVIGLTITAVGTSLPELASCIASALKKQCALAMGTIVGSNIFNLLLITPFPGLIHPAKLDPILMSRDYPVLYGITLLLLLLALLYLKRGLFGRLGGALLLIYYFVYIAFLFY